MMCVCSLFCVSFYSIISVCWLRMCWFSVYLNWFVSWLLNVSAILICRCYEICVACIHCVVVRVIIVYVYLCIIVLCYIVLCMLVCV